MWLTRMLYVTLVALTISDVIRPTITYLTRHKPVKRDAKHWAKHIPNFIVYFIVIVYICRRTKRPPDHFRDVPQP